MAPYRVLVVDDSAFMRQIISDLIVKDPQFTIAATATNGVEAIAAVAEWKPDVVTLDLEMPLMNGLEALQHIMNHSPVPVIMLSGISEDNTRETIAALQLGAFDFIRKPSSALTRDIHDVGKHLLDKLRIAVLTKRYQPAAQAVVKQAELPLATPPILKGKQTPGIKGKSAEPLKAADVIHKKTKTPRAEALPQINLKPTVKPAPSKALAEQKPTAPIPKAERPLEHKPEPKKSSAVFQHIVAVGTSTGGPRALHEVICSLPADFPAPVLVVQHMPPKFTKSLAQRLDSFSALRVVEAEQGEAVLAGVVYIAPGGYHMKLAKAATGYTIQLSEEPQRNGHRPSVDVLFESLVPLHELTRHAVIMTGMGSDGSTGMKQLAESGAESTIAESEETCIVYGMPRSAIEGGFVQTVLPLQHIASQLVNVVLKSYK